MGLETALRSYQISGREVLPERGIPAWRMLAQGGLRFSMRMIGGTRKAWHGASTLLRRFRRHHGSVGIFAMWATARRAIAKDDLSCIWRAIPFSRTHTNLDDVHCC